MIAGLLRKMADDPGREPHVERKKNVQKWKCDVCQIVSFPTLTEACKHEDECRKMKSTKEASTKAGVPNDTAEEMPVIHQFFCVPPKKGMTLKQIPTTSKRDVVVIKSIPGLPQKERLTNHTKARKKLNVGSGQCPPSKSLQQLLRNSNSVQDPARITPPLPSCPDIDKRKRFKKRQNLNINDVETQPLQPIVKRLAQRAQARQSDDNASASFAALFGAKSETLMAEHRAAEFSTKQRLKAEKERERQHRRREVTSQKPRKDEAFAQHKTKTTYPLELRFFSPSHVASPFSVVLSVAKENNWISEDDISRAQRRLRATECHTSKPLIDESYIDCPILNSNLGNHSLSSDMEILTRILSHKLKPPGVKLMDGRLWVDKHTIQDIPEDVVGECNQTAALQMIRFVDEWKVERRKAQRRRAERQKAQKTTRKKKRITQYEDDLWDDSEEESEMATICLLTGPPGSGKTSLVHAIAQHCDCSVIEINTADKRSGQALKHSIEEATRSDSLETMHRKSTDILDLIDSDDQSGNETETRVVVPIILIDEVDNLFEEFGDSGFWAGLKSVGKNAQCPIFLTANRVPEELRCSFTRYLHYETDLAEPAECAERILKIVEDEGFRQANDQSKHSLLRIYAKVAMLCHCDFRRILNALQLLLGAAQRFSGIEDDVVAVSATLTSIPTVEISNISPKQVRSDEPTLLTINGNGFSSLLGKHCSVAIGGVPSREFYVVNDRIILAICPPCPLPLGVNKSGHFEESFRACLSCRYTTVTVGFDSLGVSATSMSNLIKDERCNGCVEMTGVAWTVEYKFPGTPRSLHSCHQHLEDSSDDRQNDQKENGVGSEYCGNHHEPKAFDTTTLLGTLPAVSESPSFVRQLLDNGIASYQRDQSESPAHKSSKRADANHSIDSYVEVKDEAEVAALNSDLALIQDCLGGTPFLAGASRGFGSDLVDRGNNGTSIPNEKQLTKNAKPPSIERLLGLGWNDEYCFFGNSDTYMTQPFRARDRELLQELMCGLRGKSVSIEDHMPSFASSFDDGDKSEVETNSELSTSKGVAPAGLEEDMFLPREPPAGLLNLSALVSEITNRKRSHISAYDELLPLRKKATLAKKTQLLSIVLSDENHLSSFGRGVSRSIDSVVPDDRLDETMILDYFPLLSRMANDEKAADFAFEEEFPDEKFVKSRVTRRNKAVQRKHYFSSVNSALRNSPQLARDVGSKVAEHWLRFNASKHRCAENIDSR